MKSKILKTIAWITAIVGIISACCLDSDSYIPSIVCGICAFWWILFGYANNWFERSKHRATHYKNTEIRKPERRVVLCMFYFIK